jgi:hypothetical protein
MGTCVVNSACLQESNAYSKLCLALYILVYHSFLNTELLLKSVKKGLLLNPNSMNSNRGYFLSMECVFVQLTGQQPSEVSGT